MHKAESDFRKKLSTQSLAGTAVIFLRSREWERLEHMVRDWSLSETRPFRAWNVLYGWRVLEPTGTYKTEAVKDCILALKSIVDLDGNGANPLAPRTVCLFEGMKNWLCPAQGQPPQVVLLTLLQTYARLLTDRNSRRVFISVPETFVVPEELEHDIPVIDLDLPDAKELEDVIQQLMLDEGENRAGQPQTYPPEEMRALAQAAAGLTLLECEAAVSTAMIEHRELLPAIPFRTFHASVMNVKAEAVKSSGFLEVMKPVELDDVAGLDIFKEWILERREDFTEKAAEFGVKRPRGVTFIGPPGCLAPDTILSYRRGDRNSGRAIRLDDFYREFNGKPCNGKGRGKWDRSLPTYLHSFDAATGRVFYNRVVSVICAGMKPVYLLTTAAGRQLKLTGNHPILTKDDGFKSAESLLPGAQIIVRGSMKPEPHAIRHGRKPRVTVDDLKYYSSGWDKFVVEPTSGVEYHYKRQNRARLVYEAHMNRMPYAEYIHRLKNDPAAINLATLPAGMVVHHMDENPMNDALENLCAIFKPDHDRLHSDRLNLNRQYTEIDTVESVQFYGRTMTYDIQMEAPGNNFALDNGLIVHNTGTLSAGTVAAVLRRPAVSLEFGSLFGGIVGQTEGNIRRALAAIRALGEVVVFCDEIDRVMGMNTQGGDGGVTKRLIGTLLTFMQNNDTGAFFVFAANRAEGIDSALIRRGRIDQVFGVNVPNRTERLAILKVHLRKGKQNPDKVKGLEQAAACSEGYVGAELESAVQRAISDSFRSGLPITGADIAKHITDIKPLSVSFAEDFAAMAEWAAKNAVPASRPDPEDCKPAANTEGNGALTISRRRRSVG
jgi:SpoVK/Ycf46/Vps4 family AAA+-type ATPase